jgi:hypothetical protein
MSPGCRKAAAATKRLGETAKASTDAVRRPRAFDIAGKSAVIMGAARSSLA